MGGPDGQQGQQGQQGQGRGPGGTAVLEEGPAGPVRDRPVRVGAVDDHPVLLEGLRHALDQDGLDFVGSAADVATLLATTAEAPDVVLLDLRLAEDERTRGDLRAHVASNVRTLVRAGVRVVVYTRGEPDGEAEALRTGARGVLSKSRSLSEVRAAVLAVAAGEELALPETAQALERSLARSTVRAELSPREAVTLRLYASGLAAKQVARRMEVSEGTTKEFLSRVRAKYRAQDRTAVTRMDLYRRGVEDGYVDPHEQDSPPAEGDHRQP